MLYNFFFCFLFWAYNGLSQILYGLEKKLKKKKTPCIIHMPKAKGQRDNLSTWIILVIWSRDGLGKLQQGNEKRFYETHSR